MDKFKLYILVSKKRSITKVFVNEFLGQIILSYFGIEKQKNIGPP